MKSGSTTVGGGARAAWCRRAARGARWLRRGARGAGALLALAVLLFLPAGLAGQEEGPPADSATAGDGPEAPRTATFTGQVVSASTGAPLESAVVTLVGSGYGAVTDSAGNFRVPNVPAGPDTVEVRYIGYEPSRMELELRPNATTSVVLLLSQTVVRLADLHVEVKRGPRGKMTEFERRRKMGFGYFFTPEDIENRRPLRLPSDLMREVPSVRVGRQEFGKQPVSIVRGGRNCRPAIFLDGVHMAGFELDDIAPDELGAIEVYRGPSETPPEFMRLGNECGAIAVWTPTGGPR